MPMLQIVGSGSPVSGRVIRFNSQASAEVFLRNHLSNQLSMQSLRSSLARNMPTMGNAVGKMRDPRVIQIAASGLVSGQLRLVEGDSEKLTKLEKQLAWELAKGAADLAGLVDPTPISDAVGAGMALRDGDLWGAGLSLFSMIPYLGDAVAKPAKAVRAATKVNKLRKQIAAARKVATKVADDVPAVPKKSPTRLADDVPTKAPPKTDASGPPRENRSFEGHPVDVVSGEMMTDAVDLSLPGPMPLELSRTYMTSSSHDGHLGFGWTHTFDQLLRFEGDRIALHADDGREIYFDRPAEIGDSTLNAGSRLALRRTRRGYRIDSLDQISRYFADHGRGDGALPLDRVVDRNDNEIRLEYEGGRPVQITDSAGREILLENDAAGRLAAVRLHVDDSGQAKKVLGYEYDGAGDLVRVTDAAGTPAVFRYADHLMVQETDRAGLSFYFQYDRGGPDARCVKTWGDGDIFLRELSYDADKRITVSRDGAGNETTYHGNEAGLVERMIDPLGHETRSTFTGSGKLTSETDESGHTTRYEYNERDQVTAVIDPAGRRTERRHDADGNQVAFVDAAGNEWRREYDECGNVIATVDPAGARWRYGFDENGLVVTATDPASHITRLRWSARGDLIQTTGPTGEKTALRHDALGRLIERRDALGGTTAFEWNDLDLLARFTDASDRQTRLEYDAAGNLTRTTDPAGNTHRFGHGPMGKVTSVREPGGGVTRYRYDSELELDRVRDARGKAWRYELDPRGDLTAEVSFDGRRLEYERDPAGQISAVVDARKRRTAFERDAAGRLMKKTFHDATTEAFEYDPLGRLIRARNAAADLELRYDAVGNLVEERLNGDRVSSTYDPLGNRLSRSSELGGELRFEYDAGRRLAAVSRGGAGSLLRFERDLVGRETARHLPGDIVTKKSYLPTGELRQSRTFGKPLEPLSAREYSFGADGSINRVQDRTFGAVSFERDLDGRLQAAIYPDRTVERFVADAAGNVPGVPAEPRKTPRSRRSTRADRWTLAWDDDGNLIEKRSRELHYTFEYDVAGYLERVTRDVKVPASKHTKRREVDPALQTVTSFTYDVLGRRIQKRRVTAAGEERTGFLWDGNVLLGERPGGLEEGAAIEYLFDDATFEPMARLGPAGDVFFESDHLKTPRAAFDTTGEMIWQADFDAFGGLREERGAAGTSRFRFPGQYADDGTGLHYNRHRYYDPELRMFTTADPLLLTAGKNVHDYADDPLRFVDPFGLSKKNGCAQPVKASSAGRMQREVEKGSAPREIDRVDRGHVDGQEAHVHFKDGTSSSVTGGVHDAHKGTPNPSKKTKQWLTKHGWTPPP